jgi:hypothetical protein
VDIAAGEAADSTGTTILRNPSGCTITLSNGGAGGLDTGPGMEGPSTTYFLFLIAGSGGANPACMASTSLVPTFLNTGTTYTLAQNGNVTSGSPYVFNVGGPFPGGSSSLLFSNPVAAMSMGDVISIGATSQAISSLRSFQTTFTGDTAMSSKVIQNISALNGVVVNMLIGDPPGATTPIGSSTGGTTVLNICTSPTSCTAAGTGCTPTGAYCILMSSQANANATGASIAASGNYTITLPTNYSGATATTTPLTVYHGLYRLIGALNTDPTTTLLSFTQQGKTFYLAQPVNDVNTTLSSGTTSITLASLPAGISVKAFGRCIGGNSALPAHHVIIYSPQQPAIATASAFPTQPGFDTSSTATTTAFPFSAYTDSSQSLRAAADGSATLQCMTDGWVLDR